MTTMPARQMSDLALEQAIQEAQDATWEAWREAVKVVPTDGGHRVNEVMAAAEQGQADAANWMMERERFAELSEERRRRTRGIASHA